MSTLLTELPDISASTRSPISAPLDWVGMNGIDVPILIAEPGHRRDIHARINAQVDLPMPDVKGIHMSRIYRLVDGLADGEKLTPGLLKHVLTKMVESHIDCGSRHARISLEFNLLVQRPALVTEGLSGWRSYPVKIEAALLNGEYSCFVEVCVEYSSTCPCSAALARQIVEQTFLSQFSEDSQLSGADVAAWLRENATAATPHSQRSEAKVTVNYGDAEDFSLLTLIDDVEKAVATPVQTAVKRADEQAFAALNGQNLMFVEDSARRIISALTTKSYGTPRAFIRHIESLHPHDAVAWASA